MSNDAKATNLHSADLALLETAMNGRGGVVLTPELLVRIAANLDVRKAEIETTFPRLVAECPEETRLAVTAWVFQHLVAHAREGGSFRFLIYDRLGFDAQAYYPLYTAGGMIISNEFQLPESPEEKNDESKG